MACGLVALSVSVGVPNAAASPTTPKCATVEYRTEHLAECNRQGGPGMGPVGGGGGQGGGLLGAIRDIVRGVTGGLL